MAKATATCTCATCGKQFEITAYKPNSREARRYEEWAAEHFDECPDCREKRLAAKRAEENAEAAEAASAKGWPQLTGSEKQIAWATTIRETGMMAIINGVEKYKTHRCFDEAEYRIKLRAVEDMMTNTKASWWIDHRNGLERVFDFTCMYIVEHPEKYALAPAEEAELKDDTATVAEPEQRKHEGIVDITVTEKRVSAEYRKDDDFRAIVKGLEYTWSRESSCWYMAIGLRTGTAQERAAELGNKLLNAGFAIRIQDADVRRDAIEGNYQPMTHRWISVRGNRFFIVWGYNDDLYGPARRLPGAKYDKPGVTVPSREYEAVLDFSQTYDCRFMPDAQQLIDEMRASSAVVVPAAAKAPEYDEHPVADIMDSSRDIINDLKD